MLIPPGQINQRLVGLEGQEGRIATQTSYKNIKTLTRQEVFFENDR